MKKTDTEQLLQGLPEFIIKDMVLYFLFEDYPKRSSYITGMLETFVNQLNLKHIKDVKIYDTVKQSFVNTERIIRKNSRR